MDNTPSKQGYRNDIGTGWLREREVRCFANFVHNWDDPVDDSDFFNVVALSRFGAESEFLPVLLRHCPVKTLKSEGLVEVAPYMIVPPTSSTRMSPKSYPSRLHAKSIPHAILRNSERVKALIGHLFPH